MNSPAPALTIRPLQATDHDQWRPLWDGYNAFYGRSGPTALAEAVNVTLWHRLLDPTVPLFANVAERNGQLVGLTHYLYHLRPAQIAPICYLSDLFTAPESRGLGAGRALIESVYQAAKQHGCNRVYWSTHNTNATARKLYDQVAENQGFILYNKVL